MRAILITMVCCYLFILLIGTNIGFLFPGVNDNPSTSYFGPVYAGFIFISGLIVGCTLYIVEKMKEVNKKD